MQLYCIQLYMEAERCTLTEQTHTNADTKIPVLLHVLFARCPLILGRKQMYIGGLELNWLVPMDRKH